MVSRFIIIIIIKQKPKKLIGWMLNMSIDLFCNYIPKNKFSLLSVTMHDITNDKQTIKLWKCTTFAEWQSDDMVTHKLDKMGEK